jgi:hypothetical protein
MKTVTIMELRKFRTALEAYQAMLSRHGRNLDGAGFAAMAAPGGPQGDAAQRIGAAAHAAAATDHAKASAAFEAATVAFLGERRGPGELPSSYLLRILDVIQAEDPAAILAMQSRNGLMIVNGIPP